MRVQVRSSVRSGGGGVKVGVRGEVFEVKLSRRKGTPISLRVKSRLAWACFLKGVIDLMGYTNGIFVVRLHRFRAVYSRLSTLYDI